MPTQNGGARHRQRGAGTAVRLGLGAALALLAAVVIGALIATSDSTDDGAVDMPDRQSTSTVPPTSEFAPPEGARPLGDVTVGGAASGCRFEECRQVTVACPDIDPIDATVGVEPARSEQRGVVLMFSGGKGAAFWSSGARIPDLVGPWTEAGFDVVEIAWAGDGWGASPPGEAVGFAALACRPATFTKWVYDNEFAPLGLDGGPTGVCGFCVGGNSGGASQAAYGLTHYGLDALVDAMVVTAGPPHSLIAQGCSGRPEDAEFSYRPDGQKLMDIAYGGTPGPCAASEDPGLWEQDGVATGGSDYEFPTTRIVIVLGREDRSGATTQAQVLAERMRSGGTPTVEVHVLPGEGHKVESSVEAVELVREAVLAGG